MMRNSGSATHYCCVYVALCGVTSMIALYGAMEHANLKRNSMSAASSPHPELLAESVNYAPATSHHAPAAEEMDTKLRTIDNKMRLVLANASQELMSTGHRAVTGWDDARQKQRMRQRSVSNPTKMLLVTSSHPHECENEHGDHMLLKSLKNKVDYCRLHGIELYYNMDTLDEKMVGWWVKVSVIHMLMLARPDVEWILWVDSDAIFTNMTFELPLDNYGDYNMVLHGWAARVYNMKSWLGLNTGVFLLRNCQWSLDLLNAWAQFSPKGHVRTAAGALLTEAFPDRPLVEAEDQCSLVYLLLTQRSKWGPKVYLEHAYHLQGFYEVMLSNKYPGMGDSWWPVVMHFTGCQICSGAINVHYDAGSCHRHMERSYKFANNQVLQQGGFKYASPESYIIKHI